MEFFDSHSHYNDKVYEEDIKEVLHAIYEGGVTKTVTIGYNIEKSQKAIELANQYDFLYATVGIHPSDIEKDEKGILEQVEELRKLSLNKKIVAIGEIGLDYYWHKENKELQKFAFIKQIELANKLQLPIVIHSRDAIMDTIDILNSANKPRFSGILHCCVLNKDLIKTGLEIGLYISFAGPITFKNTKNIDIIKDIPNERLLIETDCPYLSPEPNRGKRNDSRNIKFIAQKIADIKGISVEEIANITYTNAMNVFRLKE